MQDPIRRAKEEGASQSIRKSIRELEIIANGAYLEPEGELRAKFRAKVRELFRAKHTEGVATATKDCASDALAILEGATLIPASDTRQAYRATLRAVYARVTRAGYVGGYRAAHRDLFSDYRTNVPRQLEVSKHILHRLFGEFEVQFSSEAPPGE